MRALEIGPGGIPAACGYHGGFEWTLLEYYAAKLSPLPSGAPMVLGDWGTDRLPFGDETFDLFYAAHVLEHIPWNKTAAALSEAFRVLKPGRCAEIWVPNFRYLVECYLVGRCGDEWRHDNPNDDPMLWLNGRLFTYGPEPNFHKAAFDCGSLGAALAAAGFRSVVRIDPQEYERGHRHGPISLGMRAEK